MPFLTFQEFMAMENADFTGGIRKLNVDEKDAKFNDDVSVVPQGYVESGSQIIPYKSILGVDGQQKESAALTLIDRSLSVRRAQGAEESLIDPKIEDIYVQPRKSQSGEVEYTSAFEPRKLQPEDSHNRSNSLIVGSTRSIEHTSKTTLFAHEAPKKVSRVN